MKDFPIKPMLTCFTAGVALQQVTARLTKTRSSDEPTLLRAIGAGCFLVAVANVIDYKARAKYGYSEHYWIKPKK